jgi:acetylornithine deacetylase/succinyl-diaminopimelate desuccinylase-like protein
MDTDTLRRRVADGMSQTIEELARLVAIPSIGYPGYDPAEVRASAEATRDILIASGGANALLLELDGGHPAVFAEVPGPEGAPTLLLYAHHDVQPEGDASAWQTPPFEPNVRDGRMYGRGSADDKSGIVVHAAALRALGAHEGAPLPATVKILVEGEEECTTEHLPALVRGHADLLRADIAVVADGGNYRTGVPTIGTSVRGVTDCTVSVRVMPIAQHSGSYGGAVPDAITALARMIASLHDDAGDVAVPGLRRFDWHGTPVDEDELREEAGVVDSVRLMGTGPLADRLLSRPAIDVLGVDAPGVSGSSSQIVPEARARISLRLAPGDDPAAARDALTAHLRRAAPWGVQVDVQDGEGGEGYLVDTSSPAYAAAKEAMAEAFDADVLEMGSGGSIPLVPMLANTFPGIAVLIWGAGDHRSNWHSIDESVELADVERLAVAEARFISNLNGWS